MKLNCLTERKRKVFNNSVLFVILVHAVTKAACFNVIKLKTID